VILEGSFVAHGPYVCSRCRGYVPPYEQPDTHASAWLSNVRRIDLLWLLNDGSIERWAHGQLHDPRSAVNREARHVVRDAAKRFGVPVFARQPSWPERVVVSCPLCRRRTTRSRLVPAGRVCRACSVVYG
jgi:hypothetical protein